MTTELQPTSGIGLPLKCRHLEFMAAFTTIATEKELINQIEFIIHEEK